MIVFHSANRLGDKDFVEALYAPRFKKIIFYFNCPEVSDSDNINFVHETTKRSYLLKVFGDFFQKYKSLIDTSDGVFYTSHDIVINLNVLNLYRNDRIIYYLQELGTFANVGVRLNICSLLELKRSRRMRRFKNNLRRSLQNPQFHGPIIDESADPYVDWFYLPQKYITNTLFEVFDLFAESDLRLEIAIPTIIYNIEQDADKYQHFTFDIQSNEHTASTKEDLWQSSNKDHNLILRNAKFDENPDAKEWLATVFNKDRCVVVSTNEAIAGCPNDDTYDIIIVGNLEIPSEQNFFNCISLNTDAQKKLFPELSELLPCDHYCRKNLGYLYATKKGYKFIYDSLDELPTESGRSGRWSQERSLSLLKSEPSSLIGATAKNPSMIIAMVENDPDIDPDSDPSKRVSTTSTLWINPELFICLLMPPSISFPHCDVLRKVISKVVLNKTDNYLMYCLPSQRDVIDEKIVRRLSDQVSDPVSKTCDGRSLYLIQAASKLPDIYECLRKKEFVLLSYKEETVDTTIFYPKSTWTTGRNKLREYALTVPLTHDYYIFLDEDAVFIDYSQDDGFNKFEELLKKYRPSIANPNLEGYYGKCYGQYGLGEAQSTVWYDGMYNAFSREAFASNKLFPYVDIFDSSAWWASQYIIIILSSLYQFTVVMFNGFKIKNTLHSNYPRLMICFRTLQQYVFNNMIDREKFNLNWDTKNLFQIMPHSNIKRLLSDVYHALKADNTITQLDIDVLQVWLKYFD